MRRAASHRSGPLTVTTDLRLGAINPFGVLHRHRNFRVFWTGQTLSLVGTWMGSVAQGWLALELTDDAFMVGLVSAMQSLPVLLLSLYAGVLVDRHAKLRLLLMAQSTLAVIALLLWWFSWSGVITIEWLLVFAVSSGVVAALEIPARQSLVIELVGREDLLDAIALNSGGFNLARIIGPGLAALVIAALGLEWCFAINAASYLAVLTSLLVIRLPARAGAPSATSALEGLRRGLGYMRATRQLSMLMRLVAVYSIFGIPYIVLMPVYARDVLGLGPEGYARLLVVLGVGALVGALSLAVLGRRVGRGRLLMVAAYSFATLLILLALTRVPLVAQGILFAAGLAMILNNALSNGLLQSIAADEYRGRVMSAYTFVFVGLSPAGSLLAGAVARTVGVQWAIGGGAVLMLAYAVWAFARFPEIREL